jgi:hypothetical protein
MNPAIAANRGYVANKVYSKSWLPFLPALLIFDLSASSAHRKVEWHL